MVKLDISERKMAALGLAIIGAILLFGLLPNLQLGGLLIIGGFWMFRVEDQKEKKLALIAKK